MLKRGPVGNGGYDKPVKHPVTEISPVELIAELVEILLEELLLYAMVHVPEQTLRIGNGCMNLREGLWSIFGFHDLGVNLRSDLSKLPM